MTIAYRTELFQSILDCGCTPGLGEFSEEALFADGDPLSEGASRKN